MTTAAHRIGVITMCGDAGWAQFRPWGTAGVIRVGVIFWGLAHEPPKEHCVDTCGGGLAVVAALAALLIVAISVFIGLIVTAVAACFRPRRAFLYGNLVAVIAFAVNALLLFSGLYR